MLAKVRWYEYTHESTCRCHCRLLKAVRVPIDALKLLHVKPVSVSTKATTLPVNAMEVPVNGMEVPLNAMKVPVDALKELIETVRVPIEAKRDCRVLKRPREG